MKLMKPINVTIIPAAGTDTPTTGQGKAFDSGLMTNCGTIYFLNKSNIGLTITFEDGTITSIPAWFARPVTLRQKSNQLWISQAYTLNIANPPIQQLWYEAYQQHEDVSGLYSGPIPYQNAIGGSVTNTLTQLINSGESDSPPITLISDQPAGLAKPTIQVLNNGQVTISPHITVGQQDEFLILPGGIGQGPYIIQMDGALIATDGNGGLTVVRLTAQAPVTLAAGHQETGVGGARMSNCIAADVVAVMVNFKTVMTNVPSSITLSVISSTNVNGAPFADNISKNGFRLAWTVLANGLCSLLATYTTVGN